MKIVFKNISDFRKRFPRIFQDAKKNKLYDFEFLDQETEDEFIKITNIFACKSALHEVE